MALFEVGRVSDYKNQLYMQIKPVDCFLLAFVVTY